MKWSRHDRLLVALYGVVVAAVAFACKHEALMTEDGQVYFDMTRSFWRHGTLEVPNGLEVSDTLDLVLKMTTKLGAHTYGKYPPFYAVIAAIPVGLLGVRGMYLTNALALGALVPTYHALALRVLARRTAMLSAIALPFVVPLFPYAVMELPHAVSAELVLAAVLVCISATRRVDARVAFGVALAAGLLAGLAVGVRLQNLMVAAVLVSLAFLRSRQRWAATAGLLAGLGTCFVAMVMLNRARFGVANPFSYGTTPLAQNAPAENARYFISSLEVPLGFVYPLLIVLAARRARVASNAERAATFGALAAGLAWEPLRHQLGRMIGAASVVVVSSTAFVHEQPSGTFEWFNKTLLTSSPLLALGLLAAGRSLVKRSRLPLEMAAWISFAMLVFLSMRDPDPATEMSTIGFFGFSPRHLVDLFPLLLLLATWLLRRTKLGFAFVASALGVGAPMFLLFWRTRDDSDPRRAFVLLTGALVLAAFVAAAYFVRRVRPLSSLLPVGVGACVAYSCVVTLLGDTQAILLLSGVYERWTRQVEAVTPQRFALVGFENAKDPVFLVRDRRDVVFVNATMDDSEQLRATLHLLAKDGRPIYFFGIWVERVLPLIEPELTAVPVLQEPLLWRLDWH